MQIPENIDLGKDRVYCPNCFTSEISRTESNGRFVYKCPVCGAVNERAVIIDHGIKFWIDSERNYWHESAGVLVRRPDGKILTVKRNYFPAAQAIPAGHVDAGELPLDTAIRESTEEIGLNLPAEHFKLVAEFDLPGDSCRRGSDHHRWHLYEAAVEQQFQPELNDEASTAVWLKPEEIKKLGDTAVYPLQYIAQKFVN